MKPSGRLKFLISQFLSGGVILYGLLYVIINECISCFQKGDSALHIAVRSRYAGLCEVILRDPRNSRLLHKQNKAGETPYSIDRANKQSVLSQIFGNRTYEFLILLVNEP